MISPDDVADDLGRPRPEPDSTDFRQWQLWITTTYARIEQYREKNGFDQPDPIVLDYVVLTAVSKRARLQPDGAVQVTKRIDDGSVSRTYSSGPQSGTVDLGDWWDYLWPGSDSEAFSTRPGFESDHVPWP